MFTKTALTALVLVCSGLSLAGAETESRITAFKELDGKVKRCISATVGTPAYTLKNLEVQNVTKEGFRLVFTQQNLKCALVDGKPKWIETTEDFTVEHVADDYGRYITIQVENSEVIAVTDDLKVINASKNEAKAGLQNVAIDVRNVDVIGEEGLSAFEKSGQTAINLNIFTRGLVSYLDSNGQRNILGLRSGGSYRITINLHKSDDGYVTARAASK